MKLGMPTLIELETLEDNIELCKNLNLDFIEINMNYPQYQLDKLEVGRLIQLQQEHDIFFTFHLAEDIDIGHLNRRIRNAYIEEVIGVLNIMKQIGSKVLNMHMSKGIYITLPTERVFVYRKYLNEYLNNINEFIDRVSLILDGYEQTIFIENTGIANVDYIKMGIDRMLSNSNFLLTWDIGHDHSSDFRDRDFMTKKIEKIKHYHVHDAIGKSNHLTLYDGEIDIDNYMMMAEQSDATVVLETKTIKALTESVKRLNFKMSKGKVGNENKKDQK